MASVCGLMFCYSAYMLMTNLPLFFSFLLQKFALALNHFPLSFSMESAKGTV